MFSGNIHQLPFVRDYEEADLLWHSRPEKTNGRWSANQRPIEDGSSGRRKWHYRIERNAGDTYYDVCLYHTVMARFYKPEGNTRVVEYTGDSRQTSSSFMSSVLYVNKFNSTQTTKGDRVIVPIVPYRELSTRITLVDGKADVAQSTHPRLYRLVPSGEDKQERKEFYAAIELWLDMMDVRYENLIEETPQRFFVKPTWKQGVDTLSTPEWSDFVVWLARHASKETCTRETFRRLLSQKLAAHCLGETHKKREPLPMFPSPDLLPTKGVSAY